MLTTHLSPALWRFRGGLPPFVLACESSCCTATFVRLCRFRSPLTCAKRLPAPASLNVNRSSLIFDHSPLTCALALSWRFSAFRTRTASLRAPWRFRATCCLRAACCFLSPLTAHHSPLASHLRFGASMRLT